MGADEKFGCLTKEEMENIEAKIITDEIEKAKNETELLGSSYIGSCSVLTDFMREYMEERYGNTPCTFDEISENLKLKKACEAKVQSQLEFLKQIASGR